MLFSFSTAPHTAVLGVCSQLSPRALAWRQFQIHPFHAAWSPSLSKHQLSACHTQFRLGFVSCQFWAVSNSYVPVKQPWLSSVGYANQRNGRTRLSARNSVGPGWWSLLVWSALLCSSYSRESAQRDHRLCPLFRTGLCLVLRQHWLPCKALESPRGHLHFPSWFTIFLSFLLPFCVPVFCHTQITAGILGSAFEEIPGREIIMYPQL